MKYVKQCENCYYSKEDIEGNHKEKSTVPCISEKPVMVPGKDLQLQKKVESKENSCESQVSHKGWLDWLRQAGLAWVASDHLAKIKHKVRRGAC